jgi:DNA-binding transcriptional regulator YhcF (GntR family)
MAKKTEWVYREIIFQALEKKQRRLTQNSLAEQCGVSIGLVNKAIAPLADINAIEKKPRSFVVISPKKAMLHWAGIRKLRRDIEYQTHSSKTVAQIEKDMPPCLFTCYSGFARRFGRAPSDYGEVFVYAEPVAVKDRFPPAKGRPNTIALEMDVHLMKFKAVPLGQLFVDLWNAGTWYAEDFLKALEAELDKAGW